MIDTETRLQRATVKLEASRRHGLSDQHRKLALVRAEMHGLTLSPEQRSAFDHVTNGRGLGVVVGYAGTGKSAMLGVARDAWETASYQVQGLALSGTAAENLEGGSGIASRTIASLEHQWGQGRELLTDKSILVIDEAGMIGTRQLERVIGEAEKRGAKVVLVGDPEQLQAIEAGAAFRSVAERHGRIEITDIRRQREDWQRAATRQLATERTGEALGAYRQHDAVHVAETREAARVDLIDRWDRQRQAEPGASRIILTHTNDEVALLNQAARARLRARDELGDDVTLQVKRGERHFAAGDRVMFGRNERSLCVKNGSLSRIESVTATRMVVMLDNGTPVSFDLKDYAAVDYGYAATIHKAQGMTVDRVHVLATPGLDRHAAYVALSRHRDGVDLHYGRDDFTDHDRLAATLSRERGKDMASDYARQSSIELSRAFTERRNISDQHDAPAPKRNMFDGLQLRRSPPTPSLDPVAPPSPSNPDSAAHACASELGDAVARHSRIVQTMRHAQSIGAPYTPEQRHELRASRALLDSFAPQASQNLERAMARDLRLIGETAQGRTTAAIRAMQLEAEMRDNPALRADVFVQRWQALDRQRRLLLPDHEETRANRIADRMMGMAKGLERDPQVESILRNRKVQLGLGDSTGSSVGRELEQMIGRPRSRGLGIGM